MMAFSRTRDGRLFRSSGRPGGQVTAPFGSVGHQMRNSDTRTLLPVPLATAASIIPGVDPDEAPPFAMDVVNADFGPGKVLGGRDEETRHPRANQASGTCTSQMSDKLIGHDEFNREYKRYWLPVFRFALAWTNDWAAAEDLSQEAFTRLWSKRAEFDWNRPTLPWLLTTTRRLATDRFRHLRASIRLSIQGQTAASVDSDARLRWLDLRPKLAHLSSQQRGALVLTAIVGLSSNEAAQVLGTSSGAIRAAISRARKGLAET